MGEHRVAAARSGRTASVIQDFDGLVRRGDQPQDGARAARRRSPGGPASLGVVGLQRVLPVRAGVRTLVDRALVGDGARRHVDDLLAVPEDLQPLAVGDLTDDGGDDVPLLADLQEARRRCRGSTIAHMRSCDSLMRISSGESVESRSGTASSSTRMPPEPAEASSLVAQDSPAAPRSWMPTTSFSAKISRRALDEQLLLERVADLDRGALGRAGRRRRSREASTETPPMPSPPVRAPYRMTLLPAPDALARWMSSCRITPTHSALTSGLPW